MFRVLCLALLAIGASAHLCLISPHQRGTMGGLNKPGSDDCLLIKDPPCGGRKAGEAIGIRPGAFNITFQKNLNHFNAKGPGSFVVSFGTETSLKEMVTIPDTNTTDLTLYEAALEIPQTHEGDAIIQVQYVTKNPDAPPIFYQCADVHVMHG